MTAPHLPLPVARRPRSAHGRIPERAVVQPRTLPRDWPPARARTSPRTFWGFALSVLILGPGCRRAEPDRPTAPPVTGDLQILKEGRFLFTYVEPPGTFATTDKPEIIPEVARRMVRVIDPGNMKNAEAEEVYVANVKELLQAGKTTAKPFPREVFETAAIAQLPPGASSPRGRPPAAPHLAEAHADAGARSVAGNPVVTIYGTSWCGACRTARQYFSDKKIPFADKDIEADPEAANELAEKAAKAGIPTDRVPVLDVRGRLLLGFDPARIEALLGDPT